VATARVRRRSLPDAEIAPSTSPRRTMKPSATTAGTRTAKSGHTASSASRWGKSSTSSVGGIYLSPSSEAISGWLLFAVLFALRAHAGAELLHLRRVNDLGAGGRHLQIAKLFAELDERRQGCEEILEELERR